jgi:hypothetical protein
MWSKSGRCISRGFGFHSSVLWNSRTSTTSLDSFTLCSCAVSHHPHQPPNPRPNNLTVSQSQSEETETCGESSKDNLNQLDAPEDSDKSSQALPLYALGNAELHEEGLLGSLFKSLTETLGLILVEVRNQSDMTRHYTSLESTCATLFFWDTDLGLSGGELDDVLQNSLQLRDTCLAVLVSISQSVSTCK